MCGICGIVRREPAKLASLVKRMNDAQAHRGPDGEGFYVACNSPRLSFDYDPSLEEACCCALAHRRLAILDPEHGQQPMISEDGSVATLLNGEIYNFREIRQRLEAKGHRFKTDSDAEIIGHLYAEAPDNPASWLLELNGIFAIAVWDHRRRHLLLARDHFGVKPLHYFADSTGVLFSSEIKALLAAGVRPVLNRSALHVFMNLRYVPGRETLFRDVMRLPPAHYAWVKDGQLVEINRFYSMPETAGQEGESNRREECEHVRDAFQQAVNRQLLSDVPVGMALSGGLDSSMIVAAAAKAYSGTAELRLADKTLRTFTLGFNEPSDENEDARTIADHFRTSHHDMHLAADPIKGAGEVIRAVEEPKINMIQGYALSRSVKPHIKVLFSGLGGDELFAGYDIHRYCNTLGRLHRFAPGPLNRGLLEPLGRLLWRMQSGSGILRHEHYRIGAQIALSVGDRTEFYCRLRNAWDFDDGMYARVYAHPDEFKSLPRTRSYFDGYFMGRGNYLDQVLRAEFQTKMVDDFLLNDDRVTSAHGIEGRVPFLDRNLVELAFRIPAPLKMSGTKTKTLWKESIGPVLPDWILKKKKQGFTFSSYHQWQKDLRSAVEREITPQWCSDAGLFNYSFVKQLLDYPAHANLRWHYFMAWMMLGVKEWMDVFDVEV